MINPHDSQPLLNNAESTLDAKQAEKLKTLLQKVTDVFAQQIPFNRVIGFQFDEISTQCCRLSFNKRPELVGNPFQNILHGGVTATALDVVGGCMAIAGMIANNLDVNEQTIAKKMTKTGTLDLRVDYIRPGKGEAFNAVARLLRSGNKVAVVRMELHDQENKIIALGTGTYMTG